MVGQSAPGWVTLFQDSRVATNKSITRTSEGKRFEPAEFLLRDYESD